MLYLRPAGRRFSTASRQNRVLLTLLASLLICVALVALGPFTLLHSMPPSLAFPDRGVPQQFSAAAVVVRDASGPSANRETLAAAEAAPPPPPAPPAAVNLELAPPYDQPPAVHPTSGLAVKAKIVTCPACRLNSLPEVKTFVRGWAKYYSPALVVDFVVGEDPVLHLYEDGKEVDVVVLEKMTTKEISQRVEAFGIKPNVRDLAKVLEDEKAAKEGGAGDERG